MTFPVNHRDVLSYFIQRKKNQKNPNTNPLSRSSVCVTGCGGVQQGRRCVRRCPGAVRGAAAREGAPGRGRWLGAAASRVRIPVSLEQDLTENVAPGLDSFIVIPEYKCCF